MLRLSAPAKINLFLEITGKRSDGYHTLAIVFQTISLADTLTFFPADRFSLTCSDPALPTDETNLVMRAAVKIQKELKERRGARIHLKKVVPMGAGLGGGSSDAASVLLGLPKLWRRRISASTIRRLAVELGADVPFFLKGGLCSATGIGEKLKPLPPIPKTWLVLVYPGFGVSTKEAYAKVRLPFADRRQLPAVIARSAATKQSMNAAERLLRYARNGGLFFNRFEELVFPDHPELPALKHRLLELGVTGALMSGSGSSVFGIAKSRADGEKSLLGAVQKKYNCCWLVHTL